MTKKPKISKNISKHLFLDNLNTEDTDNKLYTKFNFTRNRQNFKKWRDEQDNEST